MAADADVGRYPPMAAPSIEPQTFSPFKHHVSHHAKHCFHSSFADIEAEIRRRMLDCAADAMTSRCRGEELAKFAENATLCDTLRHCQKEPREQIISWWAGFCGDGVRSGKQCRVFLGLDPMAQFEKQLRRDPQSFSPLPRERAVLHGEEKGQKYCGGVRRRGFRNAGILPARCKCRWRRGAGAAGKSTDAR